MKSRITGTWLNEKQKSIKRKFIEYMYNRIIINYIYYNNNIYILQY